MLQTVDVDLAVLGSDHSSRILRPRVVLITVRDCLSLRYCILKVVRDYLLKRSVVRRNINLRKYILLGVEKFEMKMSRDKGKK